VPTDSAIDAATRATQSVAGTPGPRAAPDTIKGMPRQRFPFHLSRWARPVLLLFGVRDGNAYVELDDEVDARFGFFRLRTPLANVVSWRIEGPWRAITALGVRRSIRNGDITFAGTSRGGVRLDFREPVRFGPFRPPALYVTVEQMEGFGAALEERGIPGTDARGRPDPS
jgi:hypothetical protein